MRELNTQEMNHVAGGTFGCFGGISKVTSICKPTLSYAKPTVCAPTPAAAPAPAFDCSVGSNYLDPRCACNTPTPKPAPAPAPSYAGCAKPPVRRC